MWLTTLRNNWKGIAGALVAFVISFGLHSCSVSRIEAKHTVALKNQEEKLNKECDKDKAVTSEVSRVLQKDLTNRDKQLSDAKRLLNNKCVSVAKPARGYDGGTGTGQLDRKDDVNSGDLLDVAGEGEKYRLQLMACQSFVKKERE